MVDFKIAIISLGLLSGCSLTQNVPQVICPPIAIYDSETQSKAVNELKELIRDNKAPTIRKFILDYQALRERLRAVNCK